MASDHYRKQAGFVYLLATALQRRIGNHADVSEAAQWLNKHGYTRQAQQLVCQCKPEQRPRCVKKTAGRK